MNSRILKVLGLTLAVPAVGFIVASIILAGWDSEAAAQNVPPLDYVCSHLSEFSGAADEVCGARLPIALLRDLSLVGAAIPLALLALQVGLAAWAGQRRAAMAAVFPFLTSVTILATVAMVVVQAIVAIAALWFGESHFLGSVHIGIMLGLAAGALFAAGALIRAVMGMARRPSLFAVGQSLSPEQAPGLFAHVQALASRLGAAPPRHIVVGLEPTFYVTHADVQVLDDAGRPPQPLRGETLFISAPLARLLNREELDAVIGHELGHFRGQDTVYSLKFAPVYAGLGGAIHGMLDEDGAVHWAALPALYLLGFLHEQFAAKEATVGRARELEADKAGAEATSPDALARALLKISLHAEAWGDALQDPDVMLAAPERRNYSAALAERVHAGFDADRWREALGPVLETALAHPIDTHPPVRARLEALGFSVEGLDPASLDRPAEGEAGAAIIDGLEDLERRLSATEFALRERMQILPHARPAKSPPPASEPTETA